MPGGRSSSYHRHTKCRLPAGIPNRTYAPGSDGSGLFPQPKPRKAVPISLGENLVMRHCTLTIWGDLAQNMRGACPANRRVDGAGTLPRGIHRESPDILFFYPACQGRRVGILRHTTIPVVSIQPADRRKGSVSPRAAHNAANTLPSVSFLMLFHRMAGHVPGLVGTQPAIRPHTTPELVLPVGQPLFPSPASAG